LLFEMLGDYVPRSQLEVGKRAKGMDDLSDEELVAMMGGEHESHDSDAKEHEMEEDVSDSSS
jgi:hypothetical protein